MGSYRLLCQAPTPVEVELGCGKKYFDKSDCNISERLKAYKIKNGFYIAHLSNQNILIGQIKAEAENLLKEKKSLEKSSNNFEQQTMGLMFWYIYFFPES